MKRFWATAIFCLMCVHSHPGRAEIIKLHSGQTVEGKVLKVQPDSIVVDAGIGTPVTYFRDEIKEVLPDPAPVTVAPGPKVSAQADALEARAVEFIDDNKMAQGLDLIHQALELDPNAQRHMNYGSILFGNGVELFKQGKQEEGKEILKQSEAELQQAIAGFAKEKNSASNDFSAAQASFLLGEIYANAFADADAAKKHYQKALDLNGHDGAKAALEKLGVGTKNP